MERSAPLTEPAPAPSSLKWARLGLVAVVAIGLAVAYRFGLLNDLAKPLLFATSLLEMGTWGYVVFIVAYTVLQPFGVPGTVFIVAAPLIWPWQVAFVLSMIGTMSASVVGFSFARFVARDFVAARIPARFRKYDQALERSGFRTVFVLRLIFWMPQVLHSFLGVSKVPFWTHFWGSLFGYVLPIFFVSYLSTAVFDPSGELQPKGWRILVAMAVGSLLILAGLRYYEKRNATSAKGADPADSGH